MGGLHLTINDALSFSMHLQMQLLAGIEQIILWKRFRKIIFDCYSYDICAMVLKFILTHWREAEGTDSQIKPDNDFHTRIMLSYLSWSSMCVIKKVEDRSRKPTLVKLAAEVYSHFSDLEDNLCLTSACDFTDKYTAELPQPSSGLISDHPGPCAFIPTLPVLGHSHQQLYLFIRLPK